MTVQELDELRDGHKLERWVRFPHLEGGNDISLQAVIEEWQRCRRPIARTALREQVAEPAYRSTRAFIVRQHDLSGAESNRWRSVEDRVQHRAFVRLVEGAQFVRRHILRDGMEPNLDIEHASRMPDMERVGKGCGPGALARVGPRDCVSESTDG